MTFSVSQKGRDLWSHLASNCSTFCSAQLHLRGPGARGRMSRLTRAQLGSGGRSALALRTKGPPPAGQRLLLAGPQVSWGPWRLLSGATSGLWQRSDLWDRLTWSWSPWHAEM